MKNNDNKQKKLFKIIIILIIIFFISLILGNVFIYFVGPLAYFIYIILIFLVIAILATKKNKLEKGVIKEKYDKLNLDTSNFEMYDHDNKDINNCNFQFYGDIPNQLELELKIKKDDIEFSRIDFKQRAIARYNLLQNSLKNGNINDLKYFVDEKLYNFYNDSKSNKDYIENYSIKYSNLQDYEIKNDIEYLKFNVTVEHNSLNDNISIITYTITFCREYGLKTVIDKGISSKKCPNCGSSINEFVLKCEHCRQILLDDFNWKILNIEIYKK